MRDPRPSKISKARRAIELDRSWIRSNRSLAGSNFLGAASFAGCVIAADWFFICILLW